MPLLTEKHIREMMPNAGARLTPHLPFIVPALEKAAITQPLDIAAFMAQLAHESGEYRYMEELADGSAYDQRTDLGNTPDLDGDGQWFKGHGPIQVTGRDAHVACGKYLGIDLVKNPRLLCLPQYGTASATWFWTVYKPGLQAASKRGWFRVTTRIVNGGYNHWKERERYYQRNRFVLGLPPYDGMLQEDVDIRKFQRDNGLLDDGIVGPKTLAKL